MQQIQNIHSFLIRVLFHEFISTMIHHLNMISVSLIWIILDLYSTVNNLLLYWHMTNHCKSYKVRTIPEKSISRRMCNIFSYHNAPRLHIIENETSLMMVKSYMWGLRSYWADGYKRRYTIHQIQFIVISHIES